MRFLFFFLFVAINKRLFAMILETISITQELFLIVSETMSKFWKIAILIEEDKKNFMNLIKNMKKIMNKFHQTKKLLPYTNKFLNFYYKRAFVC